MNNDEGKLSVVMVPPFSGNPYQDQLIEALTVKGVNVNIYLYTEGKLPMLNAAVRGNKKFYLLHLHFIHVYLQGNNHIEYLGSCFKLIINIILTKMAGVKIVWTVHNQLFHESQYPQLELGTRKIAANLVDSLIFHTRSSLNCTAKKYLFNQNKAEVIPHGNYKQVYPK